MATQETNYYQDEKVTISNSRAVLGDKTYAVSNITSVTMADKSPNRILGTFFILGGLIGIFGGYSSGSIPMLIIGIALIIFGVFVILSKKGVYSVRIGSASGEAEALVSTDKEYIQKIVDALNEAIIKRG